MKSYYTTYAETEERYKNDTNPYRCELTVVNFYKNEDKNYGRHTRVETRGGIPVRIVATDMNGLQGACIVALVKLWGKNEVVVTYDKYGKPQGDWDDRSDLELVVHDFYFEEGDCVAIDDNRFGILANPTHNQWKYMYDAFNDQDEFGWFGDQPTRLCTEQEKQTINDRLRTIQQNCSLSDDEYAKLQPGDLVYTNLYGMYGKRCISNLSEYYQYIVIEKNGDELFVARAKGPDINTHRTIKRYDIINPQGYLNN